MAKLTRTNISIYIFIFLIINIFLIAVSSSINHFDQILNSRNKIIISHYLSNENSNLPQFHPIDSAINQFIKKYNVIGLSIAISYKGNLIYAKGFGYSDYENRIKVEPKSLFRIASVSKLITAIAIMKLHEEKKLNLNDYVFGKKGILNDSIFLKYKDKRVEKITILHLLCHRSGWSGRKLDPVLYPQLVAQEKNWKLPLSIDDAILYQLSKPLSYNPGTVYSYSNFGYALLAKIIEKVSGLSYEEYIQKEILEPIGIYDMHIGNSYFKDRFPNEVKYYSGNEQAITRLSYDGSAIVPVFDGGYDLKLLSGAGGWIASAPELLRLITAIDGFNEKPDILSEESIRLMTASSDSVSYYLGWRNGNEEGTWWRTGTLSGSIALVVRRPDNICYVVLMNTSVYSRHNVHSILANYIHNSLNMVQNWPDYDLFKINDVKNFIASTSKKSENENITSIIPNYQN